MLTGRKAAWGRAGRGQLRGSTVGRRPVAAWGKLMGSRQSSHLFGAHVPLLKMRLMMPVEYPYRAVKGILLLLRLLFIVHLLCSKHSALFALLHVKLSAAPGGGVFMHIL